jgi:hypothetical protein
MSGEYLLTARSTPRAGFLVPSAYHNRVFFVFSRYRINVVERRANEHVVGIQR